MYSESPPYAGGWQITVPQWLFMLAGTVLPARCALALMARRRRFRRGLCRRCGYDLRASPEHCPECGSEVPEAFGAIA